MIGSSIKTTNIITGEVVEYSHNIYMLISQYAAEHCSNLDDEELDEICDESNQDRFAKSFRLVSTLEFYETLRTPKEILEIYKALSSTDDVDYGYLMIEEEENLDGSVRYVAKDNRLKNIRELKIYYEEATEESLETWNRFIDYMKNLFIQAENSEGEYCS